MTVAEPIRILLVEDNPADVELTLERMNHSKMRNEVQVVTDGQQAIDCLERKGPFAEAARPDLVLLDLNLPKKNGMEVLKAMRADPSLSTIPVVVLTSSEAETDVVRSYELRANAYVRKPVDLAGYARIVSAIDGFWLSIVKFPGPTTDGAP